MHEPNSPADPTLPPVVLDLLEARVLGCLIEKEATTPEVYPLSLNALVNACNQKNNRFPVMEVGERETEGALDRLREKRLATAFTGANARAIKYKHRFSDRFAVEPLAQAMLAELLLRGPQTTAGLRGNCARLVAIPDLAACETLLPHPPGGADPLAGKFPRQPGQKEARWIQLLTGEPAVEESASPTDMPREPLKIAVTTSLPPETE